MNRLQQLRKNAGFTQEQMARELQISLSMYSKVEQGNVPASRAFMVRIKKRFPEANVDHIFFGSQQQYNCC